MRVRSWSSFAAVWLPKKKCQDEGLTPSVNAQGLGSVCRIRASQGRLSTTRHVLCQWTVLWRSVFSVYFSNELESSLPTPQGSFSTYVPTSETRTQFSTRWKAHKSLQLRYSFLFYEYGATTTVIGLHVVLYE